MSGNECEKLFRQNNSEKTKELKRSVSEEEKSKTGYKFELRLICIFSLQFCKSIDLKIPAGAETIKISFAKFNGKYKISFPKV